MLSKPPPASPVFTVGRLWLHLSLFAPRGRGHQGDRGASIWPHPRSQWLLTDQAQVGRHHFKIGAERVDIQTTATGIAGINGELR